ncbi:hypothetical protein V6N13_076705 [Hibiscus sabdariffa]
MAAANGSIRSPRIAHLLFADDCLIFGEAVAFDAGHLKDLLSLYGDCSRQVVNFEKSSVFFSTNVISENRQDVCRILDITEVDNPETYLGLPAIVGRNKKLDFRFLKDRFGSRICSWSTRSLSAVGKESNAPAHALAAEGLRLCTDRYWVEEAPPFVDRLAAQDRRSQEPP